MKEEMKVEEEEDRGGEEETWMHIYQLQTPWWVHMKYLSDLGLIRDEVFHIDSPAKPAAKCPILDDFIAHFLYHQPINNQ